MRFFHAEPGAGHPEYLACFAVNDTVRVEWDGVGYPTRVEDVGADGLWLAWPAADGGGIPVREGETLHVLTGRQQGLRSFSAVVLERRPGSPALLRLGLRRDLGSVQRRDFVRAPLMLPIRFHVLREGEETVFREAMTRNIGGGGLMMLIERGLAPTAGETLEVEIALPDAPAVARVVVTRVEPTPDNARMVRVCAHFTDIREREQDRLVGRILARQAELRRAGLL